ncbi:MAG: AAA family ATPase [Erysipelotrichaceae bacterium]|nr:AAA family ATPase [Erysipelotrichaceae bacterium]
MEKYTKALINIASKLDALTDASGEITRLASEILENTNDDKSTIALLKQIANIADSDEYSIEIKKIAAMLKNSIISYYGYRKLLEICNQEKQNKEDEDKRSLSELLEELNALVGLESVKEKVNDLIAYQKIQKLRRANNLFSSKNTLHLAFTGNPGTGKTTVARIVGYIYKQIGLLSKGHFVEVSRTDLIAGYQGQTALKVKSVIERAKGGVLFIDEAYSITENDHSDSYGRECLTELTKALEDYRDDLVVIVAGYTEPMNKFFESNPGLKSRFNTFIEFNDYNTSELDAILISMCKNNDYTLDEDAKEKIHSYFEKQISQKDENFANGRLVRNLYDDLVMNHAKRVINIENPNREDLSIIKAIDFVCSKEAATM